MRMSIWGVKNDAMFSGFTKDLPEGRDAVLVWSKASGALLARNGLKSVINPMLSWQCSRVE
jgi:hypothetical protein